MLLYTFNYVLQQAGYGMASPCTAPWYVAMVTLSIARQHQQLLQLTETESFWERDHRPCYASQTSGYLHKHTRTQPFNDPLSGTNRVVTYTTDNIYYTYTSTGNSVSTPFKVLIKHTQTKKYKGVQTTNLQTPKITTNI